MEPVQFGYENHDFSIDGADPAKSLMREGLFSIFLTAAKLPGQPIFHRLFGQYPDIDAANPAKSDLARLTFRFVKKILNRL